VFSFDCVKSSKRALPARVVKGASLENGPLHVDLVREIPEAMKPRSIPIAA
jgi:HSP20 family molecular chaperone IbpA